MFSRSHRPHLRTSDLPAANDHVVSEHEVVLHPELEAMAVIRARLEPLDGPARTRVLQWVAESLAIDPPTHHG